MAEPEKISNKQIAHEIAVNYAAVFLHANPQELPNIARLYLDTYHNILEQLQSLASEKAKEQKPVSIPNFQTVPSYWLRWLEDNQEFL